LVYIVTGNAYPTAVFKSERAALAFAESKRKNTDKAKSSPEVVWEVKGFKLR
jgi:hypothetical protein